MSIVLLNSCGIVAPVSDFVFGTAPDTVEVDTAPEAAAFFTDTAWSWAWLLILLVFVFPQARQPLVQFLTAVFSALKLPFDLILRKFGPK